VRELAERPADGQDTLDVAGIRSVSTDRCYLCDTDGTVLLQGLRDRLIGVSGAWNARRCPGCGLQWLDPRPIREDIGKLYGEGYFTHEESAWRPGRVREFLTGAILAGRFGYPTATGWRLLLGQALAAIPPLLDSAGQFVLWLGRYPGGRLLDVGCGNGDFLERMHGLGWAVRGVEPDPRARAVASDRLGRELVGPDLETVASQGEAFDVVSLVHVIEHVPDPIGTLDACRRLLRPGGLVVIRTPNAGSLGARLFGRWWLGLDVPRHLFVFSPATLRTCAERAGLEVAEIRTPAVMARSIWHTGREFRRMGGREPTSTAVRLGLSGLVFRAVEEVAVRMRPVGEEILLLARGRSR
jgi:2-polyprenyl-3-methyl-5-hydroxy-6-metoxy-1,4-benzoquinol methylase